MRQFTWLTPTSCFAPNSCLPTRPTQINLVENQPDFWSTTEGGGVSHSSGWKKNTIYSTKPLPWEKQCRSLSWMGTRCAAARRTVPAWDRHGGLTPGLGLGRGGGCGWRNTCRGIVDIPPPSPLPPGGRLAPAKMACPCHGPYPGGPGSHARSVKRHSPGRPWKPNSRKIQTNQLKWDLNPRAASRARN